ncbi:beta family protein [Streptomyces acidicola]|uniref:beta family protein n=1 Tax=Streptomyces acidicola TaxID=2596892 RepID=UPI0034459D27
MATPSYVPGLPAKGAALAGFQHVEIPGKERVQPLWTIPPPKRTVDPAEYLRRKSRAIRDGPGLHPGWLDAHTMEESLDLVVQHVWQEVGATLVGTELRPVTGPERTSEQQAATAGIAQEWDSGVGVRVRLRAAPDVRLRDRCRELVGRLRGLELDLLLDLYEVKSADEAVARALRGWRDIGTLTGWRTVVLLGGSFPWGAKELKDHDLTEWPRVEWQTWQAVRDRIEPPGPTITYGDYSTVHPRSGDARPGGGTFYEKPRYTTAEHFLIGKGAEWGRDEASLMKTLAARIVGDSEFRTSHSAGERWLQTQADPAVPEDPGSPSVWVEKGHVQHITFVAGQLREPDR